MNKNLKRALNTTAAVSMSLAMVLGAVAPVTNVSAYAVQDVAHDAYAKGCYDILAAILDDFGGLDAVKNLSYNDTATDLTDAFKGIFTQTSSNLENLTSASLKVATATDTVDVNTTIKSIATTVSTYSFDEADIDTDVVDFANHLLGVKGYASVKAAADRVHTLYTAPNTSDTNFKFWADDANDIDNDGDYAKAKAAYDAVDKVAAYAGNVAVANKSYMENFSEDMEIVKEKLDNYVADNNEVYYKDYVEALEDFAVYTDGPTVYQLVERNADIPLNKLAALEKAIKNIKADKAELSDEIEFDAVSGEEEVAYYIEGLETIVEEMKEAKDLMKTTSEVYKEFKAVKNKLVALSGATAADYEGKLADFRAQDVEAVVNYVDEVFSKFFYVKATYRTSSSTYNLTLKDADYGRYVDVTDFNTAELNALKTILTTNIDTESEESLYDMLAEKSVDVEKLYKAVTEDIEGLTLSSVITDKEAAKIITAHKAMIRLNHKNGDLYNSLTPEEKREVRANEELVDVLYKKLLYTGEVVMTGWVEDSRGWKYYTEDGERVMEGWAAGNGYWSYMKNGYSVANDWCAAKEGWYYMDAEGKMVTGKVVIDGVEQDFGTDGIWVRK